LKARRAIGGSAPVPADPIESLPGIGPRSRAMLADAGIDSAATLRRLGSVEAYCRVKRSGAAASLNLLWSLEGALTGQDWRAVARLHRASLLLALEDRERRP
jgi:DNA transformation protein